MEILGYFYPNNCLFTTPVILFSMIEQNTLKSTAILSQRN